MHGVQWRLSEPAKDNIYIFHPGLPRIIFSCFCFLQDYPRLSGIILDYGFTNYPEHIFCIFSQRKSKICFPYFQFLDSNLIFELRSTILETLFHFYKYKVFGVVKSEESECLFRVISLLKQRDHCIKDCKIQTAKTFMKWKFGFRILAIPLAFFLWLGLNKHI